MRVSCSPKSAAVTLTGISRTRVITSASNKSVKHFCVISWRSSPADWTGKGSTTNEADVNIKALGFFGKKYPFNLLVGGDAKGNGEQRFMIHSGINLRVVKGNKMFL